MLRKDLTDEVASTFSLMGLRGKKHSKQQISVKQSWISRDYYLKTGFPGVFGALDCTHIKIISPGGARAEDYRNRHGDFTLNVQTVSDASLMILDIVACWPGST